MSNIKTCVILMNMGGPTSLDAVEPFLKNLFMDPDIIDMPLGRFLRPFLAKKISKKRTAKVISYYEKIGGKSPLLDLTIEQARALEEALSSHGDFKTFVAMRYWHPFTDETIKQVLKEKPDRIILLSLYPQYSGTTTGSSINEFHRVWKAMGRENVEIKEIKEWHTNDGYIDAWADNIKKALTGPLDEKTHILFSAHGIPKKLVDRGDPYQRQTEESVRLILDRLGWKGEWSISYQSRVGPVKWLEPATDKHLADLGSQGKEKLLMVPISFVSDHSETLYEMDILYKELAEKCGIKIFKRAQSLNSNPVFIKALKNTVLASLQEGGIVDNLKNA